MGFLKSRDVVDCETLMGEEIRFFFRGEGFNVGEGDALFLFLFFFRT